jgi:hypothetical protein
MRLGKPRKSRNPDGSLRRDLHGPLSIGVTSSIRTGNDWSSYPPENVVSITAQHHKLQPHETGDGTHSLPTPPSAVDVVLAQGPQRKARKPCSRTFACPVFQNDVHHKRRPSCNGVSATNMSGVRQHLNRAPHKLGVTHCKICKEDLLSLTQHEPCTNVRPQPRGNMAELQWVSLFHKLCSQEDNIPSPCKCD